ncbi:cellulase-like family protein [Agromyces aurantiacus]|uniref:Cellulase-like family protein n=1 Tax=Agromyces aurantiacus TaxID=165814 RepID=A0ABV9RA85_9MICO|nr:cellulase-like family protein [Agromyces aurantiacus]MBM7503920.1 sugar phosphate isomerase/epimerase [Agromyces aurantiacus]
MSEPGTRYLGTPLAGVPDAAPTGPVPAHLPGRLAICLWDFSWYTRAGAGEPFEDLDRAMAETVERGYDAVRICAAPLLVAGGPELGLDALARDLEIEGLGATPVGGYYGERTRWYDAPGGYRLDVRSRLFELVDAAKRHGVVVVLASWEYQQSPAFAADPAWFRAIDAVPVDERHRVLAEAFDRLLTDLEAAGLADAIAFTELHNEVDFSILPPIEQDGEAAIRWLGARHPGQLVTASYGKPPHLAMHRVSPALGVAQFHVYSYGVLDALQRRIDIRSEGTEGFPNAELRTLLRADAPSFAEYGRPAHWKLEATVITDQMLYGYDWIDPAKWDAWLVAHLDPYREVMLREVESRVVAIAEWARWRAVPAVVGEGWVGYTPRDGRFEETGFGLELAEHGIRTALAHGVWGVVACSNAAPHHPMWADVAWQRRMTALITEGPDA